MMGVLRCPCNCHSAIRGDYESARHFGDWNTAMITSSSPVINAIFHVDANDPLEAAVSEGCPCRDNHCGALSDKPYLPPQDWTPDATGDAD